MTNLPKHKHRSKTIFHSFGYAFEGIKYALRERNMRIHLVLSIVVILLSLWLHIDTTGFLFICLAITLVILTEMLNTGMENVVDIVTQRRHHPLAKIAKDLSAGAVLVSAVFAVLVYLIVLFGPTIELIKKILGIHY